MQHIFLPAECIPYEKTKFYFLIKKCKLLEDKVFMIKSINKLAAPFPEKRDYGLKSRGKSFSVVEHSSRYFEARMLNEEILAGSILHCVNFYSSKQVLHTLMALKSRWEILTLHTTLLLIKLFGTICFMLCIVSRSRCLPIRSGEHFEKTF